MRLSEFIRTNADRIIKEWEEFAKTIPAGEGLPRFVLRDHAPAILAALVAELDKRSSRDSSQTTPANPPVEQTAETHVDLRIESGFDLVQILAEYRALRFRLLRLWREVDPEAFAQGADEIMAFSEIIDDNLGCAVPRYQERARLYRDRFLGILGHDLRNPLNAILLAAGTLSRQGLDDRQLKTVERITRSARRLSNMVNDLLDFARGRLDQAMPVTLAPANFGALVDEIVDEVRMTFPQCRISFSRQGDLNGRWDRERIKQMISNLLLNALQHGTGQMAELTAVGENDDIIFRVRNEGHPIAKELLGSIFEPLVQAAVPKHSDAERGLGLGLFIVKEIVSAHRGSISVTSTETDGTTFTVRLPREQIIQNIL
jgi:signal transduction histidine kinase